MMNWQKLLICNIPRDGGGGPDSNSGGDTQGYSVGDPSDDTSETVGPNDPSPPGDPDAPSQNAFEAAFQGGIPGFSSSPDRAQGFDAQNAVTNAVTNDMAPSTSLGSGLGLGPTSLGSFGFSGATGNSTARGGALTDPADVPGYEGPGKVADTSFGGSLAPDLGHLGPDFSSANSVLADPAVTSLSAERVGALTNVAPTYDQAALTTASQKAIDAALAGLVEAPAAIGVNPATTPTSAPSTIGSTTKSNDVAPSTTPTADSSTTKGPGTSVTGIGLVDGFLSSVMNNPVSAVTNAVVGVVGGPFGLANSISGIMGGPTIGGLVSGAVGTGSGYGNTVTSSSEKGGFSPGNNPGGGPSTPNNFGGGGGNDGGGNDGGGGGGNSGGGITSILEPTAVLPKKTDSPSTFVDYDLAKSPTAAPKYTYPDYGVYSYPDVTAPQGASFSDNYALQFPVIPEYPNLSNTNQGILDAFPVYPR